MKRKITALFCLLLALSLLAGCTGNTPAPTTGTNAPPTETTSQQPAQTTQPAQTQQPTQTQQPAHTAEPEEEPEPATEPEPDTEPDTEPEPASLMEAILGTWEIFASEVEGDYTDEYGTWIRSYVSFRTENGQTEAYLYDLELNWDELTEYGWLPVEENDKGIPCFSYVYSWNEDDPVSCEVVSVEDGVLEISNTFSYGDGTRGSSSGWFRRVEPDAEGRTWLPMTGEELAALGDAREAGTMGFLTHTYARPEEIHWHQVCYDGAGIGSELTDELSEAYEASTGWPIELDAEVIYGDDLARFVLEKTGVPYAAARHPLLWDWWYDYDRDVYIWQHGDTNAFPVEFFAGLRAGDWYKLYYRGVDLDHYNFDCSLELTCRIENGSWVFYSNLPVSEAPAVTLADIEFYDSREEAAAAGATQFIDVEEWELDEPNWCWAVFTSRFDGLRLSVDRNDYTVDDNGWMYAIGFRVPTIHLADAALDRGEKLAVKVNLAWYPTLRVAAQKDGWFGEFWFDDENGLHLWDEDGRMPAYILGHDDDAEGYGPAWDSEDGLSNFLAGSWVYYNEAGDRIEAVFTFEDYRSLYLEVGERRFQIYLTFDWETWDRPNILQMEKYYDDEEWGEEIDMLGASLGDYLVDAVQLPNEQQLTLTQYNNGDGLLSIVLSDPGAGWQHPVVLHRYTGELPEG